MNILILDDHPLTCHGFASLLSASSPGCQVQSAHTVDEARNIMSGEAVLDWLFLDINLPDDPQQQFFHSLRDTPWISKTVLLSAETPVDLLRMALAEGIRGFISKAAEPGQIVGCLNAIQAGRVFVPENLNLLLRNASSDEERILAPRLQKVQQYILRGASNKVIARELCISEHTVKEYVSSLLAYYGVSNRLNLVLKLQAGGA